MTHQEMRAKALECAVRSIAIGLDKPIGKDSTTDCDIYDRAEDYYRYIVDGTVRESIQRNN